MKIIFKWPKERPIRNVPTLAQYTGKATPMTEEQIERRVEKMVDHLDRGLLAGSMSQEDYDKAMRDLNAWAEAAYAKIGGRS